MSIWECCELLNEYVDESDPDLEEPQIEHLLQTAEAIRKDFPNHDWLHLTALIHGIISFLIFYILLLITLYIYIYIHACFSCIACIFFFFSLNQKTKQKVN